jgi:hypothetical protein
MEDNEGCIDWAEGRMNHKRSKHVDIRYHWNQQCVADGCASMHKVKTLEQIADLLTKGNFAKHPFRRLRAMLMNYSLSEQFSV